MDILVPGRFYAQIIAKGLYSVKGIFTNSTTPRSNVFVWSWLSDNLILRNGAYSLANAVLRVDNFNMKHAISK